MKISIDSKKRKTIVIPVFGEKNKVKFFETFKDKKLTNEIQKELKHFSFEAKKEQTIMLKVGSQKVVLAALEKDYSLEQLRRTYSNVFRLLHSNKESEATVNIPKEENEEIKAIVEGIDLTNYKFDKYLSEKFDRDMKIFLNINSKFSSQVKRALKVNHNVKLVRDMVNENADVMTPIKLESIVKDFARKNRLKFTSLNEKQIQKEKLNLLWAVGKGSANPPRLITCEYKGNPNSKEKTALVGKGITFDTGGVNLKPTKYVEEMKMDMGGSATAFATFKSAVELKLKKNLILVMCCAENALSGKAYKPGDVFKSHKGITVEIGNTDAEGRLVMSDGISFVQKYHKPTHIIDMATLTGACLISLGPTLIAIFSNDEQMRQQIFESGESTGDRGWQMPINGEHRDMIKSKIADINNIGGRFGGTITAAAFLEKFIDDGVKWSHLDIAGAAWGEKENFYNPQFATGRGVRLLIDYLLK